MASLFISAAHKSSGKTTVAVGLNAALRERGLDVQPFKKGPDYIDPVWLGLAAGRPCYNLDFFTAGVSETVHDFTTRSASADLAIVEGNKGLYDGLDLDGSNSNAALAKVLGTPVLLVIDVRGTMRGIAPLLIGYQVFDTDVHIAGVIANMCGGARHESKLRAAVEHYTDIPFLGAIQNQPSMALPEQHLGLVPGYEDPAAREKICSISRTLQGQIDVDRIIDISQRAKQPETAVVAFPAAPQTRYDGLKIGIARDAAFGFYYASDLDAIQQSGAELIPVNTLTDRQLPELDGLLIGGGFPERHAASLESNSSMRESIRSAIESGLPTYAECGGMMYLSQQLSWQGNNFDMVGVLRAQTLMHDKPQGRGYVKLEEDYDRSLWPRPGGLPNRLCAHEFHYSSLQGLASTSSYIYDVKRGTGISQNRDGLVYKNLLASYAHLRNTHATPWVNRFLSFVAQVSATGRNTQKSQAL